MNRMCICTILTLNNYILSYYILLNDISFTYDDDDIHSVAYLNYL